MPDLPEEKESPLVMEEKGIDRICPICKSPVEYSKRCGWLKTCANPVCKFTWRKQECARLAREKRARNREAGIKEPTRKERKVVSSKGWKAQARQFTPEEIRDGFLERQKPWPLTRGYIPGGMTPEENDKANLELWADELRAWG